MSHQHEENRHLTEGSGVLSNMHPTDAASATQRACNQSAAEKSTQAEGTADIQH